MKLRKFKLLLWGVVKSGKDKKSSIEAIEPCLKILLDFDHVGCHTSYDHFRTKFVGNDGSMFATSVIASLLPLIKPYFQCFFNCFKYI